MILESRSLTRRFDDLVAVDNVSFSIAKGDIFGLVGLNGAGKTTLIKMLITLLPPSSGSATVCGFDISREQSKVRHSIGYVPQLVSADGDLTGYENLNLYAKLYDVPSGERRSRIEQALDFMSLSDVSGKRVREYSGGMVRRLEIAQSLLHRPPLLFLDEPTVGLDPLARASVWQHILELRQEFGTTILLTTHMLDEIEDLCQTMAIMSLGVIAAIGKPEALKAEVGPGADLDAVFAHFAGARERSGFSETKRARRTARRLG